MANNLILAANNNNLDLAENIRVAEAPKKLVYTPPKVAIDYQKKFDISKAPIFRLTKTVVVSQDPPADQIVPAGTEIKVTLAVKGTLPVGSFQVNPAVMNKYGAGNIDLLLSDLDTKGQALVPILETEKGYDVLSQSEKNAFQEYAKNVGLPANSDADSKGIYEDIQFFHNF